MTASVGRPSEYTDVTAKVICDRLSNGETLVGICKDKQMPDQTTVYRWLREREEFRLLYKRARDDQAETFADQTIQIVDDFHQACAATDDNKFSNDRIKALSEATKMRIFARQWHAAKTRPKKYGDRPPIEDEKTDPTSGMSEEEKIARIVTVMEIAKERLEEKNKKPNYVNDV
jgi:hypothetical protein